MQVLMYMENGYTWGSGSKPNSSVSLPYFSIPNLETHLCWIKLGGVKILALSSRTCKKQLIS